MVMMGKIENRSLLKALLLLLCGFFAMSVNAQDPCEESGYVISTHANKTECVGSATGSATVASNGCNCMFSGCIFEWSDGQSNHTAVGLEAGTYGVTVTHPNGCVLEAEVIIEDEAAFIDDIAIDPIICSGEANGRIEIVPTNFGQLEIEWSTGAVGPVLEDVGPGSYVVFVTNFDGCVVSESFIVEDPAPLRTECLVAPPCEGDENGIATLEVQGGVPPYLINWVDLSEDDEQVAQLALGTYEVEVTDGNFCTQVMEVEVQPWEEHLKITVEDSECGGSNMQLLAPRIPNATYEWTPATGLSDPTIYNPVAVIVEEIEYTLKVTADNGCSGSASKMLSAEGLSVPAISSGSLSICPGEFTSINVFADSPAVGYSWEPTIGLSNPNSNAVVANPEETTTYIATVHLSNGCSTSAAVTVEVRDCGTSSGLADAAQSGVSIYPNPADDLLTITNSATAEGVELSFYAINGKRVKTTTVAAGEQTLDISDLQAGIYILELVTNDASYQQKLVIR